MTKTKHCRYINIFFVTTVYLFFFMIKSPVSASEAVKSSVRLCIEKVIPSLFPFLVLNEIMISSSMSHLLGRSLCLPFSYIFGINQKASAALIAGNLFGFPLGTKAVCSLYELGDISKDDAERMLCFCSNAGLGFVLGVVGGALGNMRIAICIYVCQFITSWFVSLLLRRSIRETKTAEYIPPLNLTAGTITTAITSSVIPMLNICAFVCFFACISSSVENILAFFKVSEYTSVFITGVLELTNGINRISELPIRPLTIGMSAFFVSFSGISVLLQSISITSKYSIKTNKFVFFKLFQGVISAFLCIIACKLFKLY